MKPYYCLGLTAGFLVSLIGTIVQAQTETPDAELERLQGHWRITEMTENGRAIMEHEMRRTLPGGGLVEIIDDTLLFKSPVNGSKSTKSIRLDSASYPKKIAIVEKDKVTGVGIYQLDQGKWVICIANPGNALPTEFSAPSGSNRLLMVLESFEPGNTDLQLDITSRPRISQIPVSQASMQRQTQLQQVTPPPPTTIIVKETPAPVIVVKETPPPVIIVKETPPPMIVVQQPAAGKILTDAEVRAMLLGNWQLKDSEGLVDVTFYANGTFRTYRRAEVISTFHSTFVPTPVSTGNWSVNNGQLDMRVTSSWRADKINTLATMAVRSISNKDAILVDQLGRVARAVKIL